MKECSSESVAQRAVRPVVHILEMIRFSHTLFALPFALLGAVMAWTTPCTDGGLMPFRWRHLVGILVCMAAARSAAMAFNRVADRKIDAENPRTRLRHLPTGVLSLRSVAAFTALSSAAFVAGTLLFMPNWLPLALSLPVLAFLLGYSYAKRLTALAHFWLGAALMLSPVAAWVAIRGDVVLATPNDLLPSVILGAAVLFWVAGFDMIYACLDVDFDVGARLHSVPAKIGVVGALRLAAICHLGMIAILAALPLVCRQLPLGGIYWCGVGAVGALLIYEHWLVRPDDLEKVNVAFFNVNAVVSIGLFAAGTLDLLT